MTETSHLNAAWWEAPTRGILSFHKDWTESALPKAELIPAAQGKWRVKRAELHQYGEASGYFIKGDRLTFLFAPGRHGQVLLEDESIYVAGSFNGWSQALGRTAWRLKEQAFGDQTFLALEVPQPFRRWKAPIQFKFLSAERGWLEVPEDAPNRFPNQDGSVNYGVDPNRTGRHQFTFETETPHAWADSFRIRVSIGDQTEEVPVREGSAFYELTTDLPLGATVDENETTFRVFSPRASTVTIAYHTLLDTSDTRLLELQRHAEQPVWEGSVPRNLHGSYYSLIVSGENSDPGRHFDGGMKLLDPWALAAVHKDGPGIVIDQSRLPRPKSPYHGPPVEDLVIAEAHVRDLIAAAPIELTPKDRQGFRGLTKWLRSTDPHPLREMGINAIELQPIQEFDNATPEEYHWGYMTVNFFAPESSYGLHPERASQLAEFAETVAAFHDQGISVILDVVYNHVGVPGYLLFLDKTYFFHLSHEGALTNWSGVGNDLRCDSRITRRLIVDSLKHLVEVFDVDGFRFDLAELIGIDVLREIERELRPIKPNLVLIAEPWSYRGHIAHALQSTTFSSWNDGYREFVRRYILGEEHADGIRYHLLGATDYLTRFPAQSINYVESHDDHSFLDEITENADHNGENPTDIDRRRIVLTASVLMMSLGTPMIAAGMELMRSKQGVGNTYQRGDLNVINYAREQRFADEVKVFRGWTRFRLGPDASILRLRESPEDGFLWFQAAENGLGLVAVYNADGALGNRRLCYAINPSAEATRVTLSPELGSLPWQLIGDHDAFNTSGIRESDVVRRKAGIELPPLSCALWIVR